MVKPCDLLRNKTTNNHQSCSSIPKRQSAFRVLFDSQEQPNEISPRLRI